MEIKKICIQHYRLLNDFSLELKNDLSLIVGKNNCGKTSVLSVLEKIFNKNSNRNLVWEDINLYHRREIFENIKRVSDIPDSELSSILGINLQNLDSIFRIRFLSKYPRIYDGFKSRK